MARKKPKVSLAQKIKPRSGDLEQLFSNEQDAEQASGLQLKAIRLDAILPDPLQPRRTFQDDSLQELAESIRQDGIIQPIEVTQIGRDQYMIVHGERRWRASQLAGLEVIPAVVQRRDYDEVTRFVRQLVENIQREDLNDVDRAAGLLHLRDMMQDELEKERETNPDNPDQPWAKKISWSKVGQRLGYSRQRIHQLIQLLKLPDEIKESVRVGAISERDTRIYQGLKESQQTELHQARMDGDVSPQEAKRIAKVLKQGEEESVTAVLHTLRTPLNETVSHETPPETGAEAISLRSGVGWGESDSIIPPRRGGPTSIDRLDWVRGHLARVQRQGLSDAERREILRLLGLIRKDVESLMTALSDK